MTQERISAKLAYPSHYLEVKGAKMHYLEAGEGDPILFLHGIPTSCYLWRNIIPHLAPLGRCIALDLMGFGQSDKPNIDYSLANQISYVEEFIEKLNLKNITLVMHGWGSLIGFHYAMHHQDNCKGLIFYEPLLRNLDGQETALPFQEQLAILQSIKNNPALMNHPTSLIDKAITQQVMRSLTDEELQHYRQPFLSSQTIQPLLQYLHELSDNNAKKAVNDLIAAYTQQLTLSSLPKLMLYSIPGFITSMETTIWAKEHLPNIEIVDIGEELHLAQESYPQLIGETMSVWLQGVEASDHL